MVMIASLPLQASATLAARRAPLATSGSAFAAEREYAASGNPPASTFAAWRKPMMPIPMKAAFHAQSTLAPEAFTTGVQRAISALTISAIWSAVPGMIR